MPEFPRIKSPQITLNLPSKHTGFQAPPTRRWGAALHELPHFSSVDVFAAAAAVPITDYRHCNRKVLDGSRRKDITSAPESHRKGRNQVVEPSFSKERRQSSSLSGQNRCGRLNAAGSRLTEKRLPQVEGKVSRDLRMSGGKAAGTSGGGDDVDARQERRDGGSSESAAEWSRVGPWTCSGKFRGFYDHSGQPEWTDEAEEKRTQCWSVLCADYKKVGGEGQAPPQLAGSDVGGYHGDTFVRLSGLDAGLRSESRSRNEGKGRRYEGGQVRWVESNNRMTAERFIYSASSPARTVIRVLLAFAYADGGLQCNDLRMNAETVHVGENSVYWEFEIERVTLSEAENEKYE
ncbi:hypothetical protein C8J57DRAFT_1242345 [Mycena rebaudengoi]|nr:hypothetical protein C8J57DRAFT_1242345 [Mycena rebaudengoi]